MLPEIARWMPPSYLINGSWEDSYDRTHRLLTLVNKSFMEFRSYQQDLDKHAGTSRHFEWFDEEPPQHIYNENQMRLLDTDGSCWLTMTPVEGITWTEKDLYLKGLENPDGSIGVIEIDTTENPHLTAAAIERVMGELSPEERKARQRGEYISVGGKIFKMFDESVHVVDYFVPPKDWEWYVSFDHGYNNPTAILWHAVSPENKAVTFAEHYQSEWTVDQHAERYWEMVKEFGREPDFIVGDPAINQRNGVTGTSIKQEYADQGIYIADGNNDVLSGVNRMARYLNTVGEDGKPLWTITANCVKLIWEIKKLRWATFQSKKSQFENNKQEKIHKKDDHAADSARYFFSFMPDLAPPQSTDDLADEAQKHHQKTMGAVEGKNIAVGSWDQIAGLYKPKDETKLEWETTYGYDEF
jgi:phage terminase large subunit-like protein